MAKRKLSPKARAGVRYDMKRMLGNGWKPSDILTAIAKKYPIGVESARWYLRTITNPFRILPDPVPKPSGIPEVLKMYTAVQLRRALQATRLIVPLKRALKKQQGLVRDLERATEKVDELSKKIHALVGRRGK